MSLRHGLLSVAPPVLRGKTWGSDPTCPTPGCGIIIFFLNPVAHPVVSTYLVILSNV